MNKMKFLAVINMLISLTLFSQEKGELNYGEAYGDVYFVNAQYSKAIKEYDKAIKKNGNEPYNFYLRGLSKYYLNKYLEAITDLTKSLNLTNETDYSKNWRHGPRTKDVNGDLQNMAGGGTFEHYYYHVFFYRGFSKIRVEDYYGAIEDLKEYLKYDSKNDDVYVYIGKCYNKIEKYENGIKNLTKAIELNRNNADAYYARSNSYYSLNQAEKACLDLSKAGELGKKEAYDIIRDICQ